MFDTIPYHKPTGTDPVMLKKAMGAPDDCHRAKSNAMNALRKAILLVLTLFFLMIDKTPAVQTMYSTVGSPYHGVEALRTVLFGIGMLIFASFLRAQVNQKTKIHSLRRHQ